MIDITVPSRGTRHGKPQRWSIPWWRERARRLTRKQRIRQERQAMGPGWRDATAYERFVQSCVKECRCEDPWPCPCDSVLAGGFCEEAKADTEDDDDSYDL